MTNKHLNTRDLRSSKKVGIGGNAIKTESISPLLSIKILIKYKARGMSQKHKAEELNHAPTYNRQLRVRRFNALC